MVQEISREVELGNDDDVFLATPTCTKNNPIIVTQSLDSMSTSSVSWYHSGEKKVARLTTKIEIAALTFDEREKSVSDELVEKLNVMHLYE
jgi:hypothetical protein